MSTREDRLQKLAAAVDVAAFLLQTELNREYEPNRSNPDAVWLGRAVDMAVKVRDAAFDLERRLQDERHRRRAAGPRTNDTPLGEHWFLA